MNRPFAIYPGAFDADELGYYRFGEDAGCLTPVGAGPTFVNHGAVAGQDGYRFVKADADYMSAAFPDQPARPQKTIEMWVRDWKLLPTELGYFGYFRTTVGANLLQLFTYDYGPGDGRAYIRFDENIGGVQVGQARWIGADVRDLLLSPDPIHVAAVLDADNVNPASRLRLYVNGELRAEDTIGNVVELPAAAYYFWLGYSGAPTSNIVMDEVRLSKVARYAENFPITRYGEGCYALARGPGDGVCLGGIAV